MEILTLPRIVRIAPKDIYATIELSGEEIGMLILAIDMSEVRFSSKKEEEVVAKDYFKEKFYPFIAALHKDIKEISDGTR